MKGIMELLKELHPDYDYEHSEDFIKDGLIDSLDLMRFVTLLEEHYGIRLGGTDIVPMNFASIAAIRAILSEHGVEANP